MDKDQALEALEAADAALHGKLLDRKPHSRSARIYTRAALKAHKQWLVSQEKYAKRAKAAKAAKAEVAKPKPAKKKVAA